MLSVLSFQTWLSRGAIMTVDICHNKDQKVQHRKTKSQDIYLRLLVKQYKFVAR